LSSPWPVPWSDRARRVAGMRLPMGRKHSRIFSRVSLIARCRGSDAGTSSISSRRSPIAALHFAGGAACFGKEPFVACASAENLLMDCRFVGVIRTYEIGCVALYKTALSQRFSYEVVEVVV